MRLQLLSDLHLETERFQPEPAPGAEALVLAGDVDSTWEGLAAFAGWPVPILFVAGNHEFDRRELDDAWPALGQRCRALGITLIERERHVLEDREGRRIRFVGTTRWCDFGLFGPGRQAKSERAGEFFSRVMKATHHGQLFDAAAVRTEALACRAWLANELAATGDWHATVAVTHFGPSLRSADPRYGAQPGTASFCNADDDLLPGANLWVHGHLHCRHDYRVEHPRGETRVVCNARGHEHKGETLGYDPLRTVDV